MFHLHFPSVLPTPQAGIDGDSQKMLLLLNLSFLVGKPLTKSLSPYTLGVLFIKSFPNLPSTEWGNVLLSDNTCLSRSLNVFVFFFSSFPKDSSSNYIRQLETKVKLLEDDNKLLSQVGFMLDNRYKCGSVLLFLCSCVCPF